VPEVLVRGSIIRRALRRLCLVLGSSEFPRGADPPLFSPAYLPMKVCAYCGEEAALTREHIWPSVLIAKYENLLTYSKRKNALFKGDPVVKDVCAHCNNVLLSKLDAYLSTIYDHHFSRILLPGESTSFSYDYQLLQRSLLKISFNSARADASERVIKSHQPFINFIIRGGYCPRIDVRLQIVTASRAIDLDAGTESLWEPKHLRVAEISYDGPLASRFVVRVVAFNCFWFFLVFPHRKEEVHKWAEFNAGFTAWKLRVGVKLPAGSSKISIPVEQTTWLHPTLLGSLLGASQF
jgi:hypothetical protein